MTQLTKFALDQCSLQGVLNTTTVACFVEAWCYAKQEFSDLSFDDQEFRYFTIEMINKIAIIIKDANKYEIKKHQTKIEQELNSLINSFCTGDISDNEFYLKFEKLNLFKYDNGLVNIILWNIIKGNFDNPVSYLD